MTVLSGMAFEFSIEGASESFEDGKYFVFQFEDQGEFILSGFIVSGCDSPVEKLAVVEELFQGALKSAEAAVDQEDLEILVPFAPDNRTGCECRTIHAETRDREILFLQSVFRNENGILLVTFESPNTEPARDRYVKFLESVKDANQELLTI